jgi:hypothetical protein
MEEGEDRAAGPPTPRAEGRLPYEKPAISWEQPLEAQPSLMAGCQKTAAGEGDCGSVFPFGS